MKQQKLRSNSLTYLWLSIVLSVSNFCTAQTENISLRITKLTEDFFVYTTYKKLNGTPFPSNSAYLLTHNGVVLFDTPWDTTQFQPLLDSIQKKHGQKVVICIATHYHDDRTAGLEFFRSKGIKTYSSAQTKTLCKEHQEKQAEFTFSKDTTFSVGNSIFQTYYPGEGHTRDNIVIWLKNHRILYGGCLVKSVEAKSLGNIADANLEQWQWSVKKLLKKFPEPLYVIPGHFGWGHNDPLSHTLKLLIEYKP